MTDASPDYHADVADEAESGLAELHANDEPLDRIVLKTKFTVILDACGHADVVFTSSIVDVADLALLLVSKSEAGDISYNDNAP